MTDREHTHTDTTWSNPLGLFAAFGVELEHMIVDADSLDVRPVCHDLFRLFTGTDTGDYEPDGEDGRVSWSNELALHVVETKTQRPAPDLAGLAADFQRSVDMINGSLADFGCTLLPGGMHPWMDPDRETKLWPHEYNDVYRAYDRIFGCRGHGWGNLQSTHINLPFGNDEEFGRLHAATRLVLPILPALTAASPYYAGRRAPNMAQRLEVYRNNSKRVPMMAARVVPEAVFTRAAYERDILGRLYDDLAPLDPEGLLRHEFANARGAIARFDRGAIEIRVIDNQESPKADLAVVELTVAAVRALTEERWTDNAHQRRSDVTPLYETLLQTIREADNAVVTDADLLACFGIATKSMRAGDLWRSIAERVIPPDHGARDCVDRLLSSGTLASRLVAALGPEPSRSQLHDTYTHLAHTLAEGTFFEAR